MKDWFSCSSYSGIRRPSWEAEGWEASLLSSPPLPCWQQRPVVLCRSSAPLQREVTQSSTVFFSSPSSWRNMERTSKPEECFWPQCRALQGFVCSAWCCTLCSGGRGIGQCQLQAGPQPVVPLIAWLINTQADALGQNKVPQTLGSAGNPKAIPDFTQWECIERCCMADLSSGFHLLCPWISQTAVLINLCYAEHELRVGDTHGLHPGAAAGGAVPKCSFQDHCPVFKAKPRECWFPKDLPPILDYHNSPWNELIEEKLSSPGEKQSHSPPTVCLPCTVTVCAQPRVQAISAGALTCRGIFGRICQVIICISWLEKLYLGHQAVREGKLIWHQAPSLPQPAAGRGPPGPCWGHRPCTLLGPWMPLKPRKQRWFCNTFFFVVCSPSLSILQSTNLPKQIFTETEGKNRLVL